MNDVPSFLFEALSAHSSDELISNTMEDSVASDSSNIDDDDDRKVVEDELEDYVKPSFWLFIERKSETSAEIDVLEVKFYLYCG